MDEQTFLLEIERVRRETERVKTFRLRPQKGGPIPFGFSPGQHMGVRPHGTAFVEADPSQPWRHFSLCSSPQAKDFVEIAVLNQGKASDQLHRLSPGDLVDVGRPVGSFVLREPVGFGPVFFGAGIGVAPIRSMVRYCLDKGLGTRVTLLLRFSGPEEAIFQRDFEQWEREVHGFSLWTLYSRNGVSHPREHEHKPFWTHEDLTKRIERPRDRTYFLCLPTGLRRKTESALADMGIQADRIHKEVW